MAFTWGLAEGTFFFFAPDIWLSWLALKSPKRAFSASFTTVVGALVGGIVTYRGARRLGEVETRRLLTSLPAISGKMVDGVEGQLARGLGRMVLGPLSGTPYKIYAARAGLRGDDLGAFLAWSIPARIPRFLAVAGGTAWVARRARKRFGRRPRLEKVIFFLGWMVFYAAFFARVGRED